MGEKVQVNIRVDEGQKEKWERHVDNSGQFTTLTGLIRAGVEKEMKMNGEVSKPANPALTTDLQKLTEKLNSIEDDVAWLRKQQQDDVVISDLAQDVFDELKVLPKPLQEVSSDVDKQEAGAAILLTPDDLEALESDGIPSETLNAIAKRVGLTPREVEDAIEHLQDQFLPVVEVEVDGESHYFKEG